MKSSRIKYATETLVQAVNQLQTKDILNLLEKTQDRNNLQVLLYGATDGGDCKILTMSSAQALTLTNKGIRSEAIAHFNFDEVDDHPERVYICSPEIFRIILNRIVEVETATETLVKWLGEKGHLA